MNPSFLSSSSWASLRSTAASRTVYLVRHAEAYKNIDSSLPKDDPRYDSLTPQGVEQAKASGALVAVCCS